MVTVKGTMHAVITGGLGFLGCNLALRLLHEGWAVTVIDDLSNLKTASVNKKTLERLRSDNLAILCHGVEGGIPESIRDATHIFYFASLASPPLYSKRPYHTLAANSFGLHDYLRWAKKTGARLVYTSTSEVYGDPLEHPQKETYNGNVSLVGPRACYDESKRFGEVLVKVMTQEDRRLSAGIVRLFNCYGPHMHPADGRVVPSMLFQTLSGQPLTVFGTGDQTRSFCYVDDTIEGILRYADSDLSEPVNIGSENELTILGLAEAIKDQFGGHDIIKKELPQDDPCVRKPDIEKARKLLNWEPQTRLRDGLAQTYNWMKETYFLADQ